MTAFFQSPFLSALGWALANSLWQMALLWLLFQLCFSTSKKITPRLTYLGALVFMMVGFVWFAITFVQQYAALNSISRFLAQLPEVDAAATAAASERNALAFGSLITIGEKYLPYLSASYLIILVMLFVRLANAYGYSQEIRTQGLLKIDYHWRVFVQNYAQRIGIHRAVSIFLSERIDVPATMGWLKPIILLPLATFTHLSPAQVEAVILHELSHIKRNDYLVNLVISVVETILFFNPFCQLLASTIRKERENCCDDFVIQLRCDPGSYAAALLSLEKMRVSTQQQLAIAATGSQNQLLGRVKRILNVKTRKFNYGQKLVALVLTAAVLSSFAWLSPEEKTPVAKPAAPTSISAEEKLHNNGMQLTEMKARILQQKIENRRIATLNNPRNRFNFDVTNQQLTQSASLKALQEQLLMIEKNQGVFSFRTPDSFTNLARGAMPEVKFRMAPPEMNFTYTFPQAEYKRQAYGEMKERTNGEDQRAEDRVIYFNLFPNAAYNETTFHADSSWTKSFFPPGSNTLLDWKTAMGNMQESKMILDGQPIELSTDDWQALKALDEMKLAIQWNENRKRFETVENESEPSPEADGNADRVSERQITEGKRISRTDMANYKKMRLLAEKQANELNTKVQDLFKRQKDFTEMARKDLAMAEQQNQTILSKTKGSKNRAWAERQMASEDAMRASNDQRSKTIRDQIQRSIDMYQDKLNSENQVQINHGWRDAERLRLEQVELQKEQKLLNTRQLAKSKTEGELVMVAPPPTHEKMRTPNKEAEPFSGLSATADGNVGLVFAVGDPKEDEAKTKLKSTPGPIVVHITGQPAPIKVIKRKIRDL